MTLNEQANEIIRHRMAVEEQLLRIAYEAGVVDLSIRWGFGEVHHSWNLSALARLVEEGEKP